MEVTLRKKTPDGNYTLRLGVVYHENDQAIRCEVGLPTKDQETAQAIAAGTLAVIIKLGARRRPPFYVFDEHGKIYTLEDVYDLNLIVKEYERKSKSS